MEVLGHRCVARGKGGSARLRILQFTDAHLFPEHSTQWIARDLDFVLNGYSATGSAELLKTLVEQTQPDLVIFTGDIVDGRPFGETGAARDAWKDAFLTLLRPLGHVSGGENDGIPRAVPWTFTPGNHDDDHAPWTREDLLEVFKLPGCITPEATTFNHTFTIGFADTGNTPPLRLWLFDTGRDNVRTRYDTVTAEIVADYIQLSERLPSVPHQLAYFHIPLPEYRDCSYITGQNKLFDVLVHADRLPNPYRWVPWIVRLLGKAGVVGCSTENSGLFAAFVSTGLRATFCGHDHFTDFVALRQGVYLCYGRVSSTTPPSDWEGAAAGVTPFGPGARLLEWNEASGLLETWIQDANGQDKGSRVVLDGNHFDSQNRPVLSHKCQWLLFAVLILLFSVVWQLYSVA